MNLSGDLYCKIKLFLAQQTSAPVLLSVNLLNMFTNHAFAGLTSHVIFLWFFITVPQGGRVASPSALGRCCLSGPGSLRDTYFPQHTEQKQCECKPNNASCLFTGLFTLT